MKAGLILALTIPPFFEQKTMTSDDDSHTADMKLRSSSSLRRPPNLLVKDLTVSFKESTEVPDLGYDFEGARHCDEEMRITGPTILSGKLGDKHRET